MEGPIVGRRDELAILAAAAAQAGRGAPRVVSVVGEAGAGKTALVRQGVAALDGATVVTLQADELASDRAYAMLRPLLPLDASTEPFDAGLAALDAVAGLGGDDGGLVVLLVEDLHWADRPSRQALAVLARRLDQEPVLVITTARTEHLGVDDGWDRVRADPSRSLSVDVRALGWVDVAALAASRGVALDEHAARRLHEHTGGNPLYVTAMLDELSPEVLGSMARELPAPRTFAASVVARIASLPDDARATVEALAVLNRPSPVALLARVAGVDDPTGAVDALAEAGLVVIDPTSATTVVAFTHPLVRSAVHADLSASRRRELHARAADALGAREALVHRVEAADAADDELAQQLEDEAAAALDEGGPLAAARLLRSASDLSTDAALREQRLLAAARRFLQAEDLIAVAGLRPQIEACAASGRRDLVLGQLAWLEADVDAALRHVTRAATDDDPEVAAAALVRLADLHITRYEGPDAVDAATRALGLHPTDRAIEHQAWAFRVIGVAQQEGAAAGLALFEERLPNATDDVAPADIALLSVRGLLRSAAGQHRAAVADLQSALRHARTGAANQGILRSHLHLAASLFALGRWDEALVHARIAIDLSEDHPWERASAHASASVVLSARGRTDDVAQHLAAIRSAAAQTGNRESRSALATAAVAAAHDRGDAAAIIDELGYRPDPTWLPPLSTLGWYGAYTGALIETGRLDDAANWVEAFGDAAAERGLDLATRVLVLRGQLAAARGDGAGAIEPLQAAVAAIGPDTPVLDQAAAHTHLGRLLRTTGQRKEAVASLRTARSLLEPPGAVPYLDRLDHDLDGAGLSAGERGGRRSPLDLTPREQDVATLAASGRSNKEIGAELYISVKAVEYHLRNVYGKLGIDSRRQLPGKLAG